MVIFNSLTRVTFSFAALLCAVNMNATSLSTITPSGDNEDREATSLPEKIGELKGVDINTVPTTSIATTGCPTTASTAAEQADMMNKIFIIYNIGTQKFLSAGSWWGNQTVLGDTPKLFWLQRRNEVKVNHSSEIRYPDDGNPFILEGKVADTSSLLKNVNAAITDEKSGITKLTSLQIGSQEGKGRSHATYESIKLIRTGSDGTETETVLKENYSPNGEKFQVDATDFDISTDKIEVTIDMKNCFDNNNGVVAEKDNSPENIISIGNAIAYWHYSSDATIGKDEYNIHIYYSQSAHNLQVDYVDATAKYRGDDSKSRCNINNVLGRAKIVFSKDGISVTELSPLTIEVPYIAEKAGDIVNFKYNEDGKFYIGNDNKYVIDESGSGRPYATTFDSYVYAEKDDEKTDMQTWFISSKIRSTTEAKSEEGKYLAFSQMNSHLATNLGGAAGIVGCYVDRGISDADTHREMAQWTFIPVTVDGETGNIFQMTQYLPYKEDGTDNDTDDDGHRKRQRFYLQATNGYVTGRNEFKTTDETRFYHIADTNKDGTITYEYNTAKLSTELDTTKPKNAMWKIVSLSEYLDLIGGVKSEMANPVELTYLMSDPSFSRESGALEKWKIDDGLSSTSTLEKDAKLKIGYDGYYKTSPEQQDYLYKTKDTGNSSEFNGDNKMLITHSQHMSAKIGNGGRGRMYQDIAVYYPGWYSVRCQGMSNVDAKLFVQRVSGIDGEKISEPIVKDLVKVTNSDIEKLKMDTSAHWPYDYSMPQYNAATAMNDEALTDDGKKTIEKYRNYVLIYIGEEISRENPVYLRFGIDVRNGATDVETADEFTVFDNFHLLFGGKSDVPNLVLNENFTNMDYLDQTIHTYENKPMHLYRTFTQNKRNTIMLPVSLTKKQFTETFGSEAKLAELYELTSVSVRFTYVEPENDDDVMLEAYKPYIIKPVDTGAANTKYEAKLAKRSNPSEFITVECPENHYLVSDVTLTPKEEEGTTTKYYDFSTGDEYKATIGGTTYDYTIDAKSSTPSGSDLGTLHCYATLCKTFESVTEGGNSYGYKIIDGRPTLRGGNVYIMKGGTMYKVPDMDYGYGLKSFRCWFQYDEPQSSVGQQDVKLIINGISDSETSIDSIAEADGISTIAKYADGIYTIGGQKIASGTSVACLPSGIYIVNGKKVMKR